MHCQNYTLNMHFMIYSLQTHTINFLIFHQTSYITARPVSCLAFSGHIRIYSKSKKSVSKLQMLKVVLDTIKGKTNYVTLEYLNVDLKLGFGVKIMSV